VKKKNRPIDRGGSAMLSDPRKRRNTGKLDHLRSSHLGVLLSPGCKKESGGGVEEVVGDFRAAQGALVRGVGEPEKGGERGLVRKLQRGKLFSPKPCKKAQQKRKDTEVKNEGKTEEDQSSSSE